MTVQNRTFFRWLCSSALTAFLLPAQAQIQPVQYRVTQTLDYSIGGIRPVDINNNGVVLLNDPESNGMPGSIQLWDTKTDTQRQLPFERSYGYALDDQGRIYGYQLRASVNNPGGSLYPMIWNSVTNEGGPGTPGQGREPKSWGQRIDSDGSTRRQYWVEDINGQSFDLQQSLDSIGSPWLIDFVTDVNDQGVMLAAGSSSGQYIRHAFLILSPVPEASTAMLMALGICGMGLMTIQRRRKLALA